jgi:hypothetical protein
MIRKRKKDIFGENVLYAWIEVEIVIRGSFSRVICAILNQRLLARLVDSGINRDKFLLHGARVLGELFDTAGRASGWAALDNVSHLAPLIPAAQGSAISRQPAQAALTVPHLDLLLYLLSKDLLPPSQSRPGAAQVSASRDSATSQAVSYVSNLASLPPSKSRGGAAQVSVTSCRVIQASSSNNSAPESSSSLRLTPTGLTGNPIGSCQQPKKVFAVEVAPTTYKAVSGVGNKKNDKTQNPMMGKQNARPEKKKTKKKEMCKEKKTVTNKKKEIFCLC